MSSKTEKIRSVDKDDNLTTHRVAETAHDVIDRAADKAEPVEQDLRERAAKAGEKLETTRANAGEQVEKSVANLESFVRERPVAATGIAFAAGALAAILLRR